MKAHFTLLLACLAATSALLAADRPNILWITAEDASWNWFGCYGNPQASTPRIDRLAATGIRFERAYSNAPVCAVARSTILNGVYAPTQGTQHMRSRHPIPASIKPYVTHLREAGYYCTNNSKTDYNFRGSDKDLWDQCSKKAHYKTRSKGQPFFSIFNLTSSHESSLFPEKIATNRKRGEIPQSPRIKPADVDLPPYLPDLPEIRNDIATYHDVISLLDRQVGEILDELAANGLADDTIVFFYSDHGGIIPRGKRYLEDTGTRVPMLVHVPEKWRNLSPFANGTSQRELVAFIDLAPTLLSLADMDKPAYMQGRAFLGSKRQDPPQDDIVFLYADRFDELYGMRRAITDGSYKYIRHFTPAFPAAPYSYYQFGQAGWSAWQSAWKNKQLTPEFSAIWESPQPVERLYDLTNDPLETHDLSNLPAHACRLAAMRGRLMQTMADTLDTGIIPEPLFAELKPDQPIANYAASHRREWPALVEFAFTATAGRPADLPLFIRKTRSADPIVRYWAIQGCITLGNHAAAASDTLTGLLADPASVNRVAAAFALHQLGHRDTAIHALVAELDKVTGEFSEFNLINTFVRLDAQSEIPASWVTRTLATKDGKSYLSRFVSQLRDPATH